MTEYGSVEIWQFGLIQFLLVLFIVLGLINYRFFKRPVFFVVLAGAFSALTYAVMIYQYRVMWWGLVGDEIFVASYLQKISSGHFLSDYFYLNLPPFYPPLYFWLVGGLSYVFGFGGITAAHLGVILVFLFLPPAVYFLMRKFFIQDSGEKLSAWQSALMALFVLIVLDLSAIIMKPYEYAAAVLAIVWTILLLTAILRQKLNWTGRFYLAISGAAIFLTYYFWFFPLGIAIAIFKLFTRIKFWAYYRELIIIGILLFLFTLAFTGPMVLSYLINGAENWQHGYLILEELNLYLPFFSLSVFGVVSLIGLISIIIYRQETVIRILASILLACYVWQVSNAISIFFWQLSFLPYKPFLFLAGATWSLAGAYGLGKFLQPRLNDKYLKFVIFILGWLILTSQLIFGTFIYDTKVRTQIKNIKTFAKPEVEALVNGLGQVKDLDRLTILSSGIPEISAYLPIDYYLSYNIHFSHPAANFSRRYYFVKSLTQAKDSQAFYHLLSEAPLAKIDALLLFKDDRGYPFAFWLDNFPQGGREEVFWLDASLIDRNMFEVLYEDKYFVLFKVKTPNNL